MDEKWTKAEIIAKKIVIAIILAGAFILGVYLLPKGLSLILPLVVAYVISIIASPLTKLFEKIHLPSALSSITAILLVAAVLFSISAAVILRVVDEVYNFSQSIPALYNSVLSTFDDIKLFAGDIFKLLPFNISPFISDISESIGSALTNLSGSVIEAITYITINYAKSIPTVLVSIVFSILASYFFIRDKKKLKASLRSLVGEGIYSKMSEVKNDLYSAASAYLKAQCILMSITFFEVFIALSLLNVKYSFLFAIIIAVVDAIPVFGTGTILIPWAVLSLFTGNYTLTIGLVILYVICLLVRQFLEPKILSSQIGMHPLLTILSLYIGFRLAGIFGMICGPVITLIVKNFAQRYLKKHPIN